MHTKFWLKNQQDHIKIDLGAINCEDRNGTELPQHKVQQHFVVNVTKIWVQLQQEIF
jgi:hypothetical protein